MLKDSLNYLLILFCLALHDSRVLIETAPHRAILPCAPLRQESGRAGTTVTEQVNPQQKA